MLPLTITWLLLSIISKAGKHIKLSHGLSQSYCHCCCLQAA
jgi:hypothetical protein